MRDVHDNDSIEEMLVRSGDYLMERTAQYREQPARASTSRRVEPPRYRRLLVVTAAVATLCATALAGSFIGGTPSGNVEVAEAAWSAIPATPTAEQVENVTLDCGITVNQLATIENVPPASIPAYMLKPALVDVRGTTTTAVYFTWTQATLCVQFGDGSIRAPEVSMARPDEFAWQEPIALDLFADISATMILGFLPPNITGSDPNSTGESDKLIESPWEAYVDGPGLERTRASVNGAMERFVAWVPATGEFKITFVNTTTGEERVVEARTGSLGMQLAPQTTLVVPNG
jgi:hypothetical protein